MAQALTFSIDFAWPMSTLMKQSIALWQLLSCEDIEYFKALHNPAK